MNRYAVRARAAVPAALALVLAVLLAPPATAAPPLDPDGNPVVVDHGLHDGGATDRLLEASAARASAVAAAKAPRAKKRLKTLVVPLFWAGAGKDTTNKKVKKRAKAAMKQADTYFRTVSRGRIGHKTTALGWQKIPRPTTRCGIWDQMDHLARHGSKQARRAGKNPDRFDRVIFYVTQKACGKNHYGVAGIGSLPGRFVMLEGTFAPNVLIHELGHNLGLGHSNYARCAAKNGDRLILGKASQCSEMEYADATDVMGNHPDAGWFSAPKLARLGWFTKKNLARNTSTARKTYALRPLATSTNGLKSVRVKGTKGRHYWVEYRTRTGLDAKIAPGLAGVQVRLGRPGAPMGDSSVLDMLPAPYYDWIDIQSVALGPGASWTSPEGIRFTVGSTGAKAKVTVARKASKAKAPVAPSPRAAAADLGATISWSYPDDRGTPVQSYLVRHRSSTGESGTVEVSQLDGRQLSTVLADLDPALSYSVAVRATNHRGASPWSRSVTVRPLDLAPTVTIGSPAPGATVRDPVRVEVVPTLPRGSVAQLQSAEVCFVDTSAGYDLVETCGFASVWSSPIESGKRLTIDVPAPWVDAATSFDLVAEVFDTLGRSGTARIPVTVIP